MPKPLFENVCQVELLDDPCLLENRIFEECEKFEERVELDDKFDDSLEVRWDDDNDSLVEESISFDFPKSISKEDLICHFQKDGVTLALSLENTKIENLKDGGKSDSSRVDKILASMLEKSEYSKPLKGMTRGDLNNLDHVLRRSEQNDKHWGGLEIFSTFINPHRTPYKPPSPHDYGVLWLTYMTSYSHFSEDWSTLFDKLMRSLSGSLYDPIANQGLNFEVG
ncbi:hypothetical protein RND81_04G236500 [Saponaria officinalis]|uniref:Uncharacterized protein n=1 Tax=Saponaria officinalis TaxID=3572 RepID=A0AAW1LMR3_SAPOF